MKKTILLEIVKNLKSKPKLMKKLKVLVVVGIVSFVMIGGLLIWASVSVVKHVIASTQVILSPATQEQLQSVKSELKKIQFQPLSCWEKAQSLMAVEPWLARSAIDNLKNLKVACLKEEMSQCEGGECSNLEKTINTAEGSFK